MEKLTMKEHAAIEKACKGDVLFGEDKDNFRNASRKLSSGSGKKENEHAYPEKTSHDCTYDALWFRHYPEEGRELAQRYDRACEYAAKTAQEAFIAVRGMPLPKEKKKDVA